MAAANEEGKVVVAGGLASPIVRLLNEAPNPNAAKVFVNWLLSKEGQTAYVKATDLNSRRLDVQGPAETAPDPKANYVRGEKEVSDAELDINRAREIAKEIIK